MRNAERILRVQKEKYESIQEFRKKLPPETLKEIEGTYQELDRLVRKKKAATYEMVAAHGEHSPFFQSKPPKEEVEGVPLFVCDSLYYVRSFLSLLLKICF